ncbi:MAG: ParA family protein [Actinomycetota bacterium]
MHVLSVSSLKGGVGKTTVALGIASAALSRGYRTLVVDLDPQSDATTALGATRELKATGADVLRLPKHATVHKAIVASDWEAISGGVMDLLPGSPKIVEFDSPTPSKRDLWRLEEALSRVESEYDLTIIDTPPSLNGLTQLAWTASDRALIVAEPSIFSVLAADRAMRAIAEISKQTAGRLQPLGVLVNRFIPASKEHQFRLAELEQLFGPKLLTVAIEEHSAVQQAQGAARPIHSWPGDVAADVAKNFESVLDYIFIAPEVEHSPRSLKRAKKQTKSIKIKRGSTLEQVLNSDLD